MPALGKAVRRGDQLTLDGLQIRTTRATPWMLSFLADLQGLLR